MNKRYFFHVLGGDRTHEDKKGTVLSGVLAADLQATVVATELAKDPECRGLMVYVVDEDGHEVARRSVGTG